jgi:hypothetical protein
MAHSKTKLDWILLIHQLPPNPTNLRVRIWRKLQKLGAIPIKNSVYILPFNDKTFEDFQWLRQEIESSSGEATVFRADAVEGATDDEIINAFRKQRDEEYTSITGELDGLTGAIREMKKSGHLTAARLGNYEAELDKLHKELERIVATDFFDAPIRLTAVAAYERCLKALRTSQSNKSESRGLSPLKVTTHNLAQYQGRRWVTRKNIFIDRIAAIWLIKRFIDKRPRFYFVSGSEKIEHAIGFDMYGAEFTHRGEDCTFETMIKEFGLSNDAGLRHISEIVHDLDLKDDKFNRTEAAGLGAVIRGLADLLNNDRKLIQQCTPIFDGLYEMLGANSNKGKGKQKGENQALTDKTKRPKQSRKK